MRWTIIVDPSVQISWQVVCVWLEWSSGGQISTTEGGGEKNGVVTGQGKPDQLWEGARFSTNTSCQILSPFPDPVRGPGPHRPTLEISLALHYGGLPLDVVLSDLCDTCLPQDAVQATLALLHGQGRVGLGWKSYGASQSIAQSFHVRHDLARLMQLR